MRRLRLRPALTLAALAVAVVLAVPVLGSGEGETSKTGLRTYTLRYGPVALGGYEVRQDTSPIASPNHSSAAPVPATRNGRRRGEGEGRKGNDSRRTRPS